ncbi:MAG: hypothetical protein GC179_14065 [Anaerolineaceae bacterium]|nr:hypothetical protein [Anaerolineaceae bacterium]
MQQWHNVLAHTLSLDGEWEFSIGGQSSAIQVPGTWEAQGYPRRVDGPAVYQRQIDIPADWAGTNIQLQLDAVSYYVEAEINGVAVGTHTGLWTPFAFDVSKAIRIGESNFIRLTIYKPGERFPMRESLAGFLPDVCLPFGGIWQSVRLISFPQAAISDVDIKNDPHSGKVTIKAHLHNASELTVLVRIFSPDGNMAASWQSSAADCEFSADLSVENVQIWHPQNPALYKIEIFLEDESGTSIAQISRTFGFRSLSRDNDQLLLNSTPIFLRGLLNWGWYPQILCPAPDEATIRDEFRRVRSLGYNMVKLCLYVPSQLYLDIADEEGMLLWLELPMWLPVVSERLRQQAPIEYADILADVSHHPSIIIYSLGCELGSAVDSELLGELNTILRERTSDVLVCDNSGSGEAYGGLAYDYADFNDYHFYADLHNFNPLMDHFRRDWRTARPWIFGEFCDADDYRDLDEIASTNNGDLPWWLLEQNPIHALTAIAYSQQPIRMPQLDIPFDGQALQRISHQQSFVVRKAILEKVRAKASMGGYVVTSLRDTPLATSSMFDDLGRTKYDAEAFRQFNGDSVLVLEQGRGRIWKNGGDRPAPVDRNNHLAGSKLDFRVVLSQSGNRLPAGNMQWRLIDDNKQPIESGTQPYSEKSAGHIPTEIASIYFTAPNTEIAQQYTLEVELENGVCNQWPLWIYPTMNEWPTSVAVYDPGGTLTNLDGLNQSAQRITGFGEVDEALLLASVLTPQAHNYVQNGGSAIVLQPGDGTLPVKPCPFWRESIKLLYNHPVLKDFPHRGHTDLQFYHLATDYAVDSTRLKSQFSDVGSIRPVIRRLDARQFTVLDYLVEIKIGKGTLLASTLRFGGGVGDQVNGLQQNIAGRYLLSLMCQYSAKAGAH